MKGREIVKYVIKVWPVIAVLTIAICFCTELVGGWCGIELPQQTNVELIRSTFLHAFDCWKNFGCAVVNAALVVAILPIVEELVFRYLLWKLPTTRGRNSDKLRYLGVGCVIISSGLFSAAHYLQQPFPDNAFLALFFFGLAQCWLYRRVNSFWAPVLNHSLFNLTNLGLMFIV